MVKLQKQHELQDLIKARNRSADKLRRGQNNESIGDSLKQNLQQLYVAHKTTTLQLYEEGCKNSFNIG